MAGMLLNRNPLRRDVGLSLADVVKTRLQLRPPKASACGSSASRPGLLSTGASIIRHEGLLGLWKGWSPAVLRAMCYGGLRLGLYSPVKQALVAMDSQRSSSSNTGSSSTGSSGSSGSLVSSSSSIPSTAVGSSSSSVPSTATGSSSSGETAASASGTAAAAAGVSSKLLAGIISGATAAALLSPTELVKVRLQAPNAPHSSASAVVAAVVSEGGIRGLWKGATPGVVRAAVLTASQCATYDEVKGRVMAATGWPDSAATHLATAMITGVVSTTATNPVDVVKTFMFVGGKAHSSPWACASSIYAAHGLAGFWRGWLANYARLGPQTVVTFLVVEQLRAAAGMGPLGS